MVESRNDYVKFAECVTPVNVRALAIIKWVTCVMNMDKVWHKIFISSSKCFNPFTGYFRWNNYYRTWKPAGNLVKTAVLLKY